jgi:hypothetical protein
MVNVKCSYIYSVIMFICIHRPSDEMLFEVYNINQTTEKKYGGLEYHGLYLQKMDVIRHPLLSCYNLLQV